MKHSFEVKLAAVNHYLAGHAGIISTAKLFQLSRHNAARNVVSRIGRSCRIRHWQCA
nr:hypothetical protein [Escherichia coli]